MSDSTRPFLSEGEAALLGIYELLMKISPDSSAAGQLHWELQRRGVFDRLPREG